MDGWRIIFAAPFFPWFPGKGLSAIENVAGPNAGTMSYRVPVFRWCPWVKDGTRQLHAMVIIRAVETVGHGPVALAVIADINVGIINKDVLGCPGRTCRQNGSANLCCHLLIALLDLDAEVGSTTGQWAINTCNARDAGVFTDVPIVCAHAQAVDTNFFLHWIRCLTADHKLEDRVIPVSNALYINPRLWSGTTGMVAGIFTKWTLKTEVSRIHFMPAFKNYFRCRRNQEIFVQFTPD